MEINTYRKDWRANHADQIREYQKDYFENNNTHTDCNICAGRYKKYFKKTHEASIMHQKALQEAHSKEASKNNLKEMFMKLQNRIKELEEELKLYKK